jgi:GTP cyclohydrolase I
MAQDKQNDMQKAIREILKGIEQDPKRKELSKTPQRAAEMYKFLASGYQVDVKQLMQQAVYKEDTNDMVIVRDIEFYSMCEHHLLPFFGRCHVAYIPRGRVIGVSKVPRLVEAYSRRLQLQERMTGQIARALKEHLDPFGVAVVVQAAHLCMRMRGVQKQNAEVVTSSMLGAFRRKPESRAEFLNLIKQ